MELHHPLGKLTHLLSFLLSTIRTCCVKKAPRSGEDVLLYQNRSICLGHLHVPILGKVGQCLERIFHLRLHIN